MLTLLTEMTEKQLTRTDTVYSSFSTTRTILTYIKTLPENHGGSKALLFRHFQDRSANSTRDTGKTSKNKTKQEVDTNLSSPNI